MRKLYVTFAYTIKDSTFKIVDTNMKAGIITLIDAYLREVMDTGVDDGVAVKRDVYEITLAVDLTEDTITVDSNCENLGLVAGILIDIFGKLINED